MRKGSYTTGNVNEKKGGIVYMYINDQAHLLRISETASLTYQPLKANQNIP